LVSKHSESTYRADRFDRWVKFKNRKHPAFSRVWDHEPARQRKARHFGRAKVIALKIFR
jgi:ATP-dependent DNA ligase